MRTRYAVPSGSDCPFSSGSSRSEPSYLRSLRYPLRYPRRLARPTGVPASLASSTGSTGATGATGATGSNGLAEYGYVYNESAQTVPIEADITFDSNGVMSSGITHAAGTSDIVLVNSGTYKVTFSTSGTEPSQMALFVNGAVVSGTIYGSGAGTQQNSGQVIFTIGAGDVLTLRNHSSSAAVGLQANAGGTRASANASVAIEKLRLTANRLREAHMKLLHNRPPTARWLRRSVRASSSQRVSPSAHAARRNRPPSSTPRRSSARSSRASWTNAASRPR